MKLPSDVEADEKSGFGDRLGIAMMVTGVRQVDVSRASGIDQAQLSNIVRGAREPSLANLARLLNALPGCDARWLICG